MRLRRERRTGTSVVECAIVFPSFFLVLIGVVVASLGVFRFQELASLARESARWVSVRGYSYGLATNQTPATAQDVYDNVIKPRAKLLDLQSLTYSVTWDPDKRQGAKVTVTLTYNWIPEAFFGGINLSSTSTMLVSY